MLRRIAELLDAPLHRLAGGVTDGLILAWESRIVRRGRRAWRRRRGHARLVRARLRRSRVAPALARCGAAWVAIAPVRLRARVLAGRVAQEVSSCVERITPPTVRWLRRFWKAHREAWTWLGAGIARPWRRRDASTDSGGETLNTRILSQQADTMATGTFGDAAPNCIFTCAACANEAMIVGASKYDAFRCPVCLAALLVIESRRGLTMVSTADAHATVAPGRLRSATRAATVDTEISTSIVGA